EGTGSAKKTGESWDGRWTARAGNGRALSGTWSASMGEFKGKTFQEMLALTMQRQVGGAWQSGHSQGNWWLEGDSPKRRKRAGDPERIEALPKARATIGGLRRSWQTP